MINFPPLWQFISTVALSKTEREVKGFSLYKDYDKAVRDFEQKMSVIDMFGGDKKLIIQETLSQINSCFKNLESRKIDEMELLIEFEKKIIHHSELINDNKLKIVDIFRNNYAYMFFYKSLKYFEIIDNSNKSLRKFQVITTEIFRNDAYKKNILKKDLSQKEYVEYLNCNFQSTINPDNIRGGLNHIDKVNNYFKKNFKLPS